MKRFLSRFLKRLGRPKKKNSAPLSAEIRPVFPDPGDFSGTNGNTEEAAGPVRRITNGLRDLVLRAAETIRLSSKDEAAGSGRGEFDPGEMFQPEPREEDMPYRRGGFSGEAPDSMGTEDPRESFRLLLTHAEEVREILAGLNETADEIRRELTT